MSRTMLAPLLMASLFGVPQAMRADEPPAAAPIAGELVFTNGDVLVGVPADSAQPGQLGWQSPDFVQPFQFDAKLLYLKEAHFAGPNSPVWRESDYRFSHKTNQLRAQHSFAVPLLKYPSRNLWPLTAFPLPH